MGKGEISLKTLSVIIPAYNTSKEYFAKCLASLQCKQAEDIEVIVVDDGSLVQYSIEIKEKVKNSTLDIQYYKKKNGGQNSAREYGLLKATGQFIFFMDADDYVDTEALDRIILLLKDNAPDILAFNYDVLSPTGAMIEKHNRWKGKYHEVDVRIGLLYSDSLGLQIYKRESLVRSGICLVQGCRIGEDMASATAILAAIGNEYVSGECLYHYIKHPGSTLANPPKEAALDMVRAFDMMLEQLDVSIKEKYHMELEWLAILHVLYYNTSRILEKYNGDKKLIEATRVWVERKYPNWGENPYLKSEKITQRGSFVLIKNGCPIILQYARKIKKMVKYILGNRCM